MKYRDKSGKINDKFRVLIVDDKQIVLNAAKDWIEHKMTIGGEEFVIEQLRLPVEVIESEGRYRISEDTLNLLNKFCTSAFNLILIDFGFVKQGIKTVDEVNKLHQENPKKSIRELIDEIVLNPTNIVNDALKSEKYSRNIKKNFIDYCGNLYVYTYLPSQIERDYTCADVRTNVTKKSFPNANINVIDTRKELFNEKKFEKKHDPEYYSFLIAKFLSKIIQIEIADVLLHENVDLRYRFHQIRKSNNIMAISILLPSILAGIFIPSVFSSLEQKKYILAIALVLVVMLITIILILGPRFIEKQQEKWLK